MMSVHFVMPKMMIVMAGPAAADAQKTYSKVFCTHHLLKSMNFIFKTHSVSSAKKLIE